MLALLPDDSCPCPNISGTCSSACRWWWKWREGGFCRTIWARRRWEIWGCSLDYSDESVGNAPLSSRSSPTAALALCSLLQVQHFLHYHQSLLCDPFRVGLSELLMLIGGLGSPVFEELAVLLFYPGSNWWEAHRSSINAAPSQSPATLESTDSCSIESASASTKSFLMLTHLLSLSVSVPYLHCPCPFMSIWAIWFIDGLRSVDGVGRWGKRTGTDFDGSAVSYQIFLDGFHMYSRSSLWVYVSGVVRKRAYRENDISFYL